MERKGVNSFVAIREYFFHRVFANSMKTKPIYEEFATKSVFELVADIMVALNKLIISIHHVIIGLCRSVGIDLDAPERHNETSAPFTPTREARLPAFLLFDQDTKR
jgi:hypothetical protein